MQWEHAFGLGVTAGYKVWARYDDLAQMKWDDGLCSVFDDHNGLQDTSPEE